MEPILKKTKTYWTEINSVKRNDLIVKILNDGFSLFKSKDTLSKVSANQMLDFGVSVLSSYGIVCEINELDGSIEELVKSKTGKYRYVKIISEADRGYISEL